MAAYTFVWMGSGPNRVAVSSVRESWSYGEAALFAETDKISDHVYRTTAGQIRVRLRLLGHREVLSDRIVTSMWPGSMAPGLNPSDLVLNWVANIDDHGAHGFGNMHRQAFVDHWKYIWGEERALFQFLVTRVPPETIIELDASEPVVRGHMAATATLARDAQVELANKASGAMPTIVLTEGKTDSEALQAAMELVRPGYVGFMTFLDYRQKPEGSAGSVATALKAFAAAGVGNRVIGLFDNDLAGHNAMKKLKALKGDEELPERFIPLALPDLQFADTYPVESNGSTSLMNVNGIGVTIEFFYGEDILQLPSKAWEPMELIGDASASGSRQGRLIHKGDVQERFRQKVKRAKGGTVVPDEWDNLGRLLDHIANS